MARSVDEKVKYNKRRGGAFGDGYVFGVNMYNNYGNCDTETQRTVKAIIDSARNGAQCGDMRDKGIMCGVRDAANERKSKQRK